MEFASADGPITINLIPIAVVTAEARLLVAAPEASWSKHPAGRLFPSRGLQKPILVEVAAATMEEPEDCRGEYKTLGWPFGPKVGEEVESRGIYAPHRRCLGCGVRAGAHSSWSVASGGGGRSFCIPFRTEWRRGRSRACRGGRGREGWRQASESGADDGEAVGWPTRFFWHSHGSKPKACESASWSEGSAKGVFKDGSRVQCVGSTVVASALEAGIPQEQLDVLGGLLKKTSRMQDLPRPAQTRRKSVLSESEDEEREEAEEKGGDAEEEKEADLPGGPVEKAVMQLTKIVNSLAKRRDKKKDLEEFLDEASTGDSSTSTSSSRSKAAAYKRLRSALVNKPEALVSMLEEAMEEDFLQLRAGPGSDLRGTSARAWLEPRSKLQYYPGSIRQAWILGANGRVAEAKARSLWVAALDQASLDGGNWLMAQEMLLEPAAPFAAFQGRRLPEAWEQTVTKLVDKRWAEILMWKLKDKDSFNEARKRLSIGKNPNAVLPTKDGQIVDPNPKKGGKGGKGGKPGLPKGASEAEGKD